MKHELSHVAPAPLSTVVWDAEQVKLLKDHFMPDASDAELEFFAKVCANTKLDPWRRQIHAVKRRTRDDKGNWVEKWTYQTGIDGLRAIAARGGLYAGSDDAVFDTEDAKHPNRATMTVWKVVAGVRCPFTATARWTEYVQTLRDGTPNRFWASMPYGQLAKCAEALALRKGFPEETGGIYINEEMDHLDSEEPAPNESLKIESLIEKTEPAPPEEEASQEIIEAEVVHEPPPNPGFGLPDKVARLIQGGWKAIKVNGKPLGGLPNKDLRALDPEAHLGQGSAAIYASFFDEIVARATAGRWKGLQALIAECAQFGNVDQSDYFADLAMLPSTLRWVKKFKDQAPEQPQP